MSYVTQEAGEEARHDVEVRKVVHQFALLREVVEVASELNDLRHVVVAVLVIGRRPYALEQIVEVLVGNRELLKQPVVLE